MYIAHVITNSNLYHSNYQGRYDNLNTFFSMCCLLQKIYKTDSALHCTSTRALRGGDGNEENPASEIGSARQGPSERAHFYAESESSMLMHRACARTPSPYSFLLLEHRLQPTPSPLCGLASWPLLGACFMFPGKQFLTWLYVVKIPQLHVEMYLRLVNK